MEKERMIFKCRKCGMENELTDAYCQGCGNDLNLYGDVVFASQQPEPEPKPELESKSGPEPQSQPEPKQTRAKKASLPKKTRVLIEIVCLIILSGIVGIICYNYGESEGFRLGAEKERKMLEPYLVEKSPTPKNSNTPNNLVYKENMSFSDDSREGTYSGETKNGKPHGTGKLIYENGDVYEGEWEEGKRNGTGKYTYEKGDVYEGNFQDSKMNGIGKFTWKDSGAVYEGEFKNNKRDGTGKFIDNNGNVFEGEWEDDEMNGTGKSTFKSGAVYEGEFQDSKMNGIGTYTWSNGNICEGEWKDGNLYNGSKTYQDTDGKLYKDVYAYGKIISTEEVKE